MPIICTKLDSSAEGVPTALGRSAGREGSGGGTVSTVVAARVTALVGVIAEGENIDGICIEETIGAVATTAGADTVIEVEVVVPRVGAGVAVVLLIQLVEDGDTGTSLEKRTASPFLSPILCIEMMSLFVSPCASL